jgi:hypothetical protein
MSGKCSVPRCDYDAERMRGKAKLCLGCYYEKTAIDVRRFQRTMKADKHTRPMFGDD